ncbi:hypothetical protein EU527_06590 [Candidatus Thorarchaeota archaeon]|nr:MAG: hypothetical protein EU527_06590 [Candidatus Thorarchaeota archaeon]
MKPFVVFMCAKCRGFTNAPVGQKRRRCSYCGSIIDISKANLAVFDSPEQASAAVKEFNASKGGDDFKEAVERSRVRIKSLMPSRPINAKDITEGDDQPIPQGKRRILMALLEKEARGKSCSLDRLEELSEAKGLDWTWVEKQIEFLSNNGALIFPRPWTVQLVVAEEKENETVTSSKDVSNEIMKLLRGRGGKVRVDEIIQHFSEKGISETSIENSLERLMRAGELFQPSPGLVSII